MKNLISYPTIILLFCLIVEALCFERRHYGLPKLPTWGQTRLYAPLPPPRVDDNGVVGNHNNNNNNNNRHRIRVTKDDDDDDGTVTNFQPKRRNFLFGSVSAAGAAISSALFGTTTMSKPRQAIAAGLDESELRRIAIFERNAPSVVFIDTFAEKQDAFSANVMEVPIGSGSGFVWDKDGHIVTNYHVIRNAKVAQIAIITRNKGGSGTLATLPPAQQASTMTDDDPISNVFTSSNTRARGIEGFSSEYQRSVYKATVVGVDPGKDIAVLKVEAPKEVLTPISVGTSTGLRVGQQALAIGNPFGLDHTLTVGVISGLGREVKSPVGRPITNVIQADCSINPGNSGGPLLNSLGDLIGMNTAIYSTSGASAGIGFAIPVDTVKYIVNTLIRDGKVIRPILGISYLESKQARALGIGRGVLVLDVPAGSPAAKAGLKGTRRTEAGLIEIGDIIVQVNAKVINTEANLFQALENLQPGDIVQVKVLRLESKDDALAQREVTITIPLLSSEVLNKDESGFQSSSQQLSPQQSTQPPSSRSYQYR